MGSRDGRLDAAPVLPISLLFNSQNELSLNLGPTLGVELARLLEPFGEISNVLRSTTEFRRPSLEDKCDHGRANYTANAAHGIQTGHVPTDLSYHEGTSPNHGPSASCQNIVSKSLVLDLLNR